MLTAEQLALLFTELQAWREEGLLDAPTHQRLRGRYGPPVSPGQALERELEAEATALVEHDPRSPGLDEELAAEAAAHLADEARVVAAVGAARAERESALAQPVEERAAALVSSVAAAAHDVAALVPPEAPRPVAAELVERESIWSRHLRPFLFANSLWLAGGLLILFGSLYFLRLIWDDLSNLLHHTVIAGALHLYAAAFFGAGYVLSRKRQAHVVGRILFCFTVAILPLGSVALGELVALLLQAGGLFVPLGVGALLLGLSLQAGLLAVIGGLFERACQRPLIEGSLGIALLTSALAPVQLRLPQLQPLLLLAAPLGFLLLARGLLGLCRHRVLLRESLLLAGSGLLWSFLVLIVRASVASPITFTHYAALVVGVAALLVVCDRRLRAATGEPPRLSPLGLLLHGVVLLGVALSLCGLGRLGYFHLGARLGVLASSGMALWVLAGSAWLHGRSAFAHLAATTGLLTYFFLPAPFAGLLLLAQRWVSRALGYAHEPLPVAYYGLTFIPYLLLVAGLAIFLRQRRRDLSVDLQRFLMVAGALLSILALASRGDLRPMLWTWPIYAAGAYLGAVLFARPGLRLSGHALTLAALWVLGLFLAPRAGWLLSSSVLLSSSAVLASLASLLPRREASRNWTELHFACTAIAASALSLAALPLDARSLDQWLVTSAAITAAMALLTVRLRSRVTAHLAAGGLLLDVLLAHSHLGAREDGGLAWALLVAGAAATALVFWARRADEQSPRHRLVGQPATVLAALALALSLLAGIIFLPPGFALLPALALCALALVARGASTVVLGAAALAAALGSTSDQLFERSWPMVLSGLSALLALAAPSLPRRSPRTAARRTLGLSFSAGLIATVALVAAAKLASEAGSDVQAYRWGFLGALGLSLYLAALTRAHRDARDAWLALAALALSSSVAALLFLRATVDPISHGLWAYGALAALLSTGWVALEARLSRPHLRRVAAVASPILLLLPLGQEASHLLLALMRCQPSGDWLLGMVSLPPGRWAVLCAGAALAAALLLRRVRPGWTSRQLLLGAALGLVVALQGLVAPAAHLTPALALATIALAAARAARPHEVSLGWPMAVAALAFLAAHLHLEGPGPSMVAAAATVALLPLWRRAAGTEGRLLAHAFTLTLLGTGQLATIWLAATFSTGRYPAASVAALLGLAALAVAPLIDALSRRRLEDRPLAHLAASAVLLAAVEAICAVLGCRPAVPGFVLFLSLALLVAGGALLVAMGRRHGHEWLVHAALLSFTAAYLLARRETALSAAGPWLDAATLLLASQAAQGLGRRAEARVSRRPLLVFAALWPALGLLILGSFGPAGGSLVALLIALHYGALARALGNRHLATPGLIFATVAALLSCAAMEWSDPLLVALPVVAALLVLTHVYRDELGRAGSSSLRCALLLGLYTLGVSQALTSVTPLQGVVVVPALCVVGLVAGTLLRVRSYVLMSVAFLAADLILNMLRYGLTSRPLGALFLTLLGLVIVSGMVVFTLERERILRRYSTILGELRSWD